jgi:uncharacterized protein YrzB (UPF0473 family)
MYFIKLNIMEDHIMDDENKVVLVDENGENVEFELLDTIEMEGKEYVVLLPIEEGNDDGETDEVIILRVEPGEGDEDTFVTIDDEDELNEVFEEFQDRMDEMEDLDDDDE